MSGFLPGDNDDPAIRHRIALPVLIGVVADLGSRGDMDVFIDYDPPEPAISSNLHPAHDDGIFDNRVTVNADVAADN